MQTLGNIDLLEHGNKIGFLASRKYTAAAVLNSFDWALAQKKLGKCIVSGFHSPLEQNIIKFFLNGDYPVIVVLSRSLYANIPELWQPAIDKGNMLIISPFEQPPIRPTEITADIRNRWILENTPAVAIGWASQNGKLRELIAHYEEKTSIVYL